MPEATNAEVFRYLAWIIAHEIPYDPALLAAAIAQVDDTLGNYEKTCGCSRWPCYHIALFILAELVTDAQKEKINFDA